MTDTELLDWLEQPLTLYKNAKVLITAKYDARLDVTLCRIGRGPWRPTLREAIEAHRARAIV